jgi:hypothetical protein
MHHVGYIATLNPTWFRAPTKLSQAQLDQLGPQTMEKESIRKIELEKQTLDSIEKEWALAFQNALELKRKGKVVFDIKREKNTGLIHVIVTNKEDESVILDKVFSKKSDTEIPMEKFEEQEYEAFMEAQKLLDADKAIERFDSSADGNRIHHSIVDMDGKILYSIDLSLENEVVAKSSSEDN